MKSLNETRRDIAYHKENCKLILANQKWAISQHKLLHLAAAKRAIAAVPLPNLPTPLPSDVDQWLSAVRPDPAPEPPSFADVIAWATAEAETASDVCRTPLLAFATWAMRGQGALDKRRLCVPLEYVKACGEKLIRYRHERFPLDLDATLAEWAAHVPKNSLTEIRELEARAL